MCMKKKHKTSQTLSLEAKTILRQLAETSDMSQSAVLDHLIRHAPEYWGEMKNTPPGKTAHSTHRVMMVKKGPAYDVR